MKRWGVVALSVMLLLQGCTHLPSPLQRRAATDALAQAQGWQAMTLPAGAFDIEAYAPVTAVVHDRLTVYIEGDGLAWVTPSLASQDPTPLKPIGLQLALAQPDGQAAYLARPCQYTMNPLSASGAPAHECSQRYWTQARFAPEVIAAENLALDALKSRFQARQLVLVGFSGGGAVAALLAARRHDVARLVTVAGNLDHVAWTRLHGIDPLTGSLNPADERAQLERVPQWHVVGDADRVMPPAIAQGFAAGFPGGHQPRVIVMAGHDHLCCWVGSWPSLWRQIQADLAVQP
jgi:dienelactone hydrolase